MSMKCHQMKRIGGVQMYSELVGVRSNFLFNFNNINMISLQTTTLLAAGKLPGHSLSSMPTTRKTEKSERQTRKLSNKQLTIIQNIYATIILNASPATTRRTSAKKLLRWPVRGTSPAVKNLRPNRLLTMRILKAIQGTSTTNTRPAARSVLSPGPRSRHKFVIIPERGEICLKILKMSIAFLFILRTPSPSTVPKHLVMLEIVLDVVARHQSDPKNPPLDESML